MMLQTSRIQDDFIPDDFQQDLQTAPLKPNPASLSLAQRAVGYLPEIMQRGFLRLADPEVGPNGQPLQLKTGIPPPVAPGVGTWLGRANYGRMFSEANPLLTEAKNALINRWRENIPPQEFLNNPTSPEILPTEIRAKLSAPIGLPELGETSPLYRIGAPQLNRWMNVQPKQLVHGANPGEQVLKDSLLGPTKAATLTNVNTTLKSVIEPRMDSILNTAGEQGVRINAEDAILDAMNDATKTIGKRTDVGFHTSMNNILDDILHKHPYLNEMTPMETHALKVDIGNAITWGKGTAYETDLNRMMVDMYGRLNKNIAQNVPELGEIQTQWGNLYQASKSLKLSILKDAVGSGTGPKLTSRSIPKSTLAEQLSETLDKLKRKNP